MKKCYIVGAGELFGSFSPSDGDLVIAADGGYDHLLSLGITPNVIIGDLDSVRADLPEGIEVLRHKVEKDETDAHLAYLEGARRGYTEFELFGGTGGREDHTFANYSLLLYAKNEGNNIKLISENMDICVIKNEKREFFGREGATFSAFAIGGVCRGVTIDGLYYTAWDAALTPEFPLAVSNKFVGKTATVEVRQGALLVMTERKN